MPDRSETAARGSETKDLIAILILISAASAPAAATCTCSSGGGFSYNFLGDSAMNINMGGYEEFARDNVPISSIAIPDVKTAALSRLSLNLRDRRNER